MSSHDMHRPAAIGVAAIVAELLTGSLTADQDLSAADRDEAIAITQAMARLLLGTPLRSDGKLTVKTLAAEAGLRRNKLTHKHTGLKELFYALVRTQDARPAIVVDPSKDNDQLRKTVTELRHANHEQAETIKRFARVVHVLEVENQRLRERAVTPRPATNSGNVRVLHPPPRDRGQPAEPSAGTLDTPDDPLEDHR